MCRGHKPQLLIILHSERLRNRKFRPPCRGSYYLATRRQAAACRAGWVVGGGVAVRKRKSDVSGQMSESPVGEAVRFPSSSRPIPMWEGPTCHAEALAKEDWSRPPVTSYTFTYSCSSPGRASKSESPPSRSLGEGWCRLKEFLQPRMGSGSSCSRRRTFSTISPSLPLNCSNPKAPMTSRRSSSGSSCGSLLPSSVVGLSPTADHRLPRRSQAKAGPPIRHRRIRRGERLIADI